MPIRLIHVSDIHFGSGESHGRINPESGLNVRFEDFAEALRKVVTISIEKHADVFLFSGDAYRNATPEPVYQKELAGQIKRLSDAQIATVLVVGNHDQILKSSSSHSMSVFQSLSVPHVTVIDKPVLLHLDTANGALQLIGLPHVTRHLLMTHEKYAGLTASALDKLVVSHVSNLLQGFYDLLDPALPAVVTAHMMVDQARCGAEEELAIGYSMAFPLDMLVDDRIDYVALGHVHKHQVLRAAAPAIVYAGSLERVDFSEEREDKGFVEVFLARKATEYKFHSINPRPFLTVEVNLSASEDPTARLCDVVEQKV